MNNPSCVDGCDTGAIIRNSKTPLQARPQHGRSQTSAERRWEIREEIQTLRSEREALIAQVKASQKIPHIA